MRVLRLRSAAARPENSSTRLSRPPITPARNVSLDFFQVIFFTFFFFFFLVLFMFFIFEFLSFSCLFMYRNLEFCYKLLDSVFQSNVCRCLGFETRKPSLFFFFPQVNERNKILGDIDLIICVWICFR